MRDQEFVHVAGAELAPFCSQLRHQLTMLTQHAEGGRARRAGLTIWSSHDRAASLYWSWVMTDEGTPVLADPLAIRSNVLFVEPGVASTVDDQLVGINTVVNALPWQREVLEHLARLEGSGRTAPRGGRGRGKSLARGAAPSVAIAA